MNRKCILCERQLNKKNIVVVDDPMTFHGPRISYCKECWEEQA